MHKAYQRRAFLLFALVALEPAAGSAARADNDSLWDVLTRAGRATANRNADKGYTAAELAPAPRQSLGPVPGFTLPTNRSAADAGKGFTKKIGRRRGMFGAVGDFFDRLEEATGTKIKASGHHTLSFRWDSISGGSAADSAYQGDQYFGRGGNGVYNDTELSIDATLFKYFHYQTHISNSLFGNQNDNRVKLDYNPNKKLRVEVGDFSAGFQGNSLIDFSRYLNGIQIKNEWSRQLKTTMLYSQTKAETRTLLIPGNDSSGPYYAFAGQIVEGSDHVRIDNRDLSRDDYTLDPYTGELRFRNGIIVLHTSTIAVTYETLGYNQSRGNIYGFRTDFAPRAGLGIGLTYVAQQSRGSNPFQPRTQEFYGYNTPAATYILDQPIDLTKPLTVTVGGVPLVQGVDFVVDTSLRDRIVIRQAVLSSVIVQVRYIPLNTNPIPGNRSVMGLDGRLGLGKLGTLTMETAFSGLSLTGSQVGGRAWQVRADLNPFRNLHTNLTLRDVSPSFSSIQSPGFNLNERSMTLTSDYNPTRNLKLNLNWEHAQRPSYSGGYGLTTSTITTNGYDNDNTFTLGANYTFARNASLNLSRNSLSTNYALGGHSDNTNDTLALNYTLRSLSFEAALSRNTNSANALGNLYNLATGGTTTGATNPLYSSNSNTFSKRIGISWNPKSWATLSTSFSDNTISSSGTGATFSHADARDAQITAALRPHRNLSINYSFDLSDTGNLSSLGSTLTGTTSSTGATGATSGGNGLPAARSPFSPFAPFFPMPPTRDLTAGGSTAGTSQTGLGTSGLGNLGTILGGGGYNYGLGGYGNYSGYYGTGAYNPYGISSFGGRSASHRLSIDYHPRQNLQIGLHLDTSTSLGDYQYNSNRFNRGVDLFWQASKRFQINASFNVQNVAYVGSLGSTDSSSMMVWLQGHPFGGKIGTTLSWTSLKTNSTLNFAALSQGAGFTAGTTTGATGTTTPANPNTLLNSLALRIDYPIARRETLFIDMLTSDASGYLASTERDLRFGLDYDLTANLKFSLGWQLINRLNKDVSLQQYNYKASSLLAEFGLHF